MGDRIVGFHAIEEALKQVPAGSVLFICRNREKRNGRLESLALSSGKVSVRKITKAEMDRMIPGVDHRGSLLELGTMGRERLQAYGRVPTVSVKDFLKNLSDGQEAFILLLDGITDVHNLGAILRSADQFSVDLVVVPGRRSAQANETVFRISSGAAQYVPLATVTNLVHEIELLQDHGFWVYGADMGGEPIHRITFPRRTAIVLGSEGEGMGRLVAKRCDHVVSIPTSGHIDSLNVSVAAGIVMYEVRRQQMIAAK